ncbi:hypothetical protein LUW76_18000 [Actinomadura madurae]|uniref:hypothetical protein n=1 Tax=Actinomadura madurae TaxID=1993 RepID=UPI002025EBF7|nr:hypothetical protein [Actinomadura madurae]URM96066.1 hypothetical protein LUW76_18000 [Actinomadura madurae]
MSAITTMMAMESQPPPSPCPWGSGAPLVSSRSHSVKSSQARSSQDGLSRW